MTSVTDVDESTADQADGLISMLRRHISCDALIAASGSRRRNGTIKIDSVIGKHGSTVSDKFVQAYEEKASHDVIGYMFSSFPRIVQCVSLDDYSKLKGNLETGGTAGVQHGRVMATYLGEHKHLMLAGLESSMGLAWVTFYRDNGERFGSSDVEIARYLVPWELFRWQQSNQKEPQSSSPDEGTGLLPLTMRELRLAISEARGKDRDVIAREFGLKRDVVRQDILKIKRRLSVSGKNRITPEDLERYSSAKKRR